MTIDELKIIIANGEHQQLELKKTTGELKDGFHSACAFLNSDGGWLIFGIAPSSLKILGQQVTDNTQRDIANALSLIEPKTDVRVTYIDIPEKAGYKIIALHFDKWSLGKVPYTFHGRPYYRVESTTLEMPRQMFEERLRASNPQFFAWERQIAEHINISDLDLERIKGAIRIGTERGRLVASAITEPIEKILDKLQLLNNGNPNNAAVMLFGNNTFSFPQLRMRMARFRGNDKNSFIDNQRVDGNFFTLLDAGISFFFKHLSQSAEINGIHRDEHLEIPIEALRETLINALCHRQYEKYNLSIGISIFDDRIEIENPGVFPPQLTTENIKLPHSSYPYNPIIADVLFKTAFVENWGSGISRIIDVCHNNHIQEPQWQIRGGFVLVSFKRPSSDIQNDTQTGTQIDTQTGTQISDLDQWIEQQIMHNPKITTEQLALLSNKGVRTIKRRIANNSNIQYVGSGYSGHWELFKVGHPKNGILIDTQTDTQTGTQISDLDQWIEQQISHNPKITTEQLALLSNKGVRTIKRRIANNSNIQYVGSGYSGHWKIIKKK